MWYNEKTEKIIKNGDKIIMTTKQDLVMFYSEYNKVKDLDLAEEKIDGFINALKAALKENDKIAFRGFGSFEVRETTERMIVDPKDSSNIIHAKPRKYIKFKVSKNLQDSLCLEEKV